MGEDAVGFEDVYEAIIGADLLYGLENLLSDGGYKLLLFFLKVLHGSLTEGEDSLVHILELLFLGGAVGF